MTATLPPYHPGSDEAEGSTATDPDGMSIVFSLTEVERRSHLVPNLLIAGVSHAGAEGLGAALGRHPQVARCRSRAHRYAPLRYGRAVQTALADYDRYFSGWSGQPFRLEVSPGYFDGGRALVTTVNRELPGLRAVIVLREPAERLWAGYQDKLSRARLPAGTSYETFVDRCLALRANGADRFETNRYFRTLSSGFYVEYLTAWLDAFGHRAKVVFAEEFETDPDAGLGDLYEWLELDPASPRVTESPSPHVVTPGEGEGLQSFHDDVPPVSAPRPQWPALVRPTGALRPVAGGRLRRVAGAFLPRQSDRVRARIESMYAGANHELALLLREHGYRQLPAWLANA